MDPVAAETRRRWPARLARGALLLGAATFTLGFACYGMVLSPLWTALWGLVAWPRLGRVRGWLAAGLLAVGLGAWWVPFHEFADATDRLSARLDQGPEAYSTREKLGIYGLHGLMTAVGWSVGLREVGWEAAGLHLPGGGTVVVHSDFPLRSPRVRRRIRELEAGGRGRVAWTYQWDREAMRVALALNALDLEVRPTAEGTLDVRGTVEIAYPHRSPLPFFHIRGRTIAIEEGLFGMLQDAGWLFPYEAEYRFHVDPDAPILRDPAPVRGPLERVLVHLFA